MPHVERYATRLTVLLLVATTIPAGCGEVKVNATPATGGVDASDDVKDGGVEDTASAEDAGAQCLTDYDCADMKGKTPCKVPTCDAGACKLETKDEGALCTDSLKDVGECEMTTCNADGECKAKAVDDGTTCGFGVCGKKCDAGSCVAATAADYDDGDPCTNDYCDQGRKIAHDPITDLKQACDDGSACTVDEVCLQGKCQGTQASCDDGFDCTFDTCDLKSGCDHTPQDSKCDDGDPCSKDACDAAAGCTVTGAAAGACDDGNGCTTNDACAEGECVGKPDPECGCAGDGDCAKYNDVCLGKYACANKVCVLDEVTATVCPDTEDTLCLVNTCVPASGACEMTPQTNDKPCDDDDACTSASACTEGVCIGTAQVGCDDGNPCTSDACDAKTGCTFLTSDAACDDGQACTTGDACNGGVCLGAKVNCDDEVSCTFDTCDIKTGKCASEPDPKLCDDGNPCTADTCDAKAGCKQAPDANGKCDDGKPCTADTCKNGTCVSENQCECQASADCNDNNPCTADSCDKGTGKCKYDAPGKDGAACDTGNKCHQANTGACSAGQCKGGKPVVCTSDSCHTANCNPATGKCESLAKADGTVCAADKDGCTFDTCKAGKCTYVAKITCADGTTSCQVGVCKSTGATTHTCSIEPKPTSALCDDGKYCTVGDHCDGKGACAAGPARVCPGGGTLGDCAYPFCDEVGKKCTIKQKPKGTACNDGKYCTIKDACDGLGKCASTTAMACKSTNCHKAFCDEAGKICLQDPIPGCCATNLQCDDGQPCTGDTCVAAKCTHTGIAGCCNATVWSAAFDTNLLYGVTITNSAGPGKGWQLATKSAQAKSPPGALYYGSIAAKNYDFGTSDGDAISPTMVIPVGGGKLAFDVWLGVEAGTGYDILSAFIVIPGTKDTQIWTKGGTALNQWVPITVDLSKYAGMSLRIKLRFETKDAINNKTLGVFIDNWRVLGQCKQAG